MNLNLERVIRFVAVAEEMSFTKAAKRLQVDQPWLSRQIQQLEEQLGFPLFERSARRISLTSEGHEFLDHARRVASASEEMNRIAQILARSRRDELRLGCLNSTYWLPVRKRLVGVFNERYPSMTLTISSGPSPFLLNQLVTQQIDVALVMPVADMSGYDYVRLYWGRPGLLIPKEHPLANKPVLRMADLAGCKLAATARRWNELSFNRMYGPFFAAGMIERPVPEGTLAVRHYVRAEHLFMLVFRSPMNSDEFEHMVYRDVADNTAEVQFGLARSKGDERLAVRRMWSVAKELAQDQSGGEDEPEIDAA